MKLCTCSMYSVCLLLIKHRHPRSQRWSAPSDIISAAGNDPVSAGTCAFVQLTIIPLPCLPSNHHYQEAPCWSWSSHHVSLMSFMATPDYQNKHVNNVLRMVINILLSYSNIILVFPIIDYCQIVVTLHPNYCIEPQLLVIICVLV